MPTDKQIAAYLNKEIKQHVKNAEHFRALQAKSVGNATAYGVAAEIQEGAAAVLEAARDFVQGVKHEESD